MKCSFSLIALVILTSLGTAQVKCEANINGYRIHTVYVAGDLYNGLVHAYKHLSEETCLTPVTNPAEADAILYIHRSWHPNDSTAPDPSFSVNCVSNSNSTFCSDSSGNVMTVNCSGGVCTSYYGPNLVSAAAAVFNEWVSTRWYQGDVAIYTRDYKLLWKSENQKGDWLGALWPDLVRLGTNSPVCRVSSMQRSKYKNYRHWASTTCGVEFDPLVSIDLKIQAKLDKQQMAQDEKDQMLQNAKEAQAERNTAEKK